MNQMKETLKELLRECKDSGIDRPHRHEMAERYRNASAEFRSHVQPPALNEFKPVYDKAEATHCEKKARGYIQRHTRTETNV